MWPPATKRNLTDTTARMAACQKPLSQTRTNSNMLIRYIQPKMNERLMEFPLKDRPGLVKSLLDEGITHLGIQIDLGASYAILHDPAAGTSKSQHRFAVNLSTGEREVAGDAPLAWQM